MHISAHEGHFYYLLEAKNLVVVESKKKRWIYFSLFLSLPYQLFVLLLFLGFSTEYRIAYSLCTDDGVMSFVITKQYLMVGSGSHCIL